MRLEGWALCVAVSITLTTVAPAFSPALIVASVIVCVAAILKGILYHPNGG